MRVPRSDHFPRAARRDARRQLVRSAGASDRERVARGPRTVCRDRALLGRPRFDERRDPARFQARRAGAPRYDGAVRRGARTAVIFRSMRGFLVRLLISVLGLWIAEQLLPGIVITGTGALLVSALVLGVVN